MLKKLLVFLTVLCALLPIPTLIHGKNSNFLPMSGVVSLAKLKYGKRTILQHYQSGLGLNQIYCKTTRMVVSFPPKVDEYTLVLGREVWFDPIFQLSQSIALNREVFVKGTICISAVNLKVIDSWSEKYYYVYDFPYYPVTSGDFYYYIDFMDPVIYDIWNDGISYWCRSKSVGNSVSKKIYSYAIFTLTDINTSRLNFSSSDLNCTYDYPTVISWIRQKYKFYRYS